MFEKIPLTKDNGKIATCGLYVGGMKQKEVQGLESLKISQLDEIIEKNIDNITEQKYLKFLYKKGERRMKDGKIKIYGTKKQKIEMIKPKNAFLRL